MNSYKAFMSARDALFMFVGTGVRNTYLFGYLRKMSLMTTMASCTT